MNSSIKTSLEDYFEFLSDDDIRLKGHRIGIDDVIDYYLQGYSLLANPDRIAQPEPREDPRDHYLLPASSC